MSDLKFSLGPRYVTLDLINGPWYLHDSLPGMFIRALTYLGWVGSGCPIWTVTEVDRDSGTVTINCEGPTIGGSDE